MRVQERSPTLLDCGAEKAPPLVHRYLTPKGRDPQPGDVALCGWVKKLPWSGFDPPLSCVVCAHMDREWGRA